MKKRLLAILMSILVVLAFTACSGGSSDSGDSGDAEAAADEPAQTFELKFSITGSKEIRMSKIWEEWAQKVEEATNGGVKCTFYYDSTLLASDGQYAQLTSGVADIGDIHRYANDGFVIGEKWKGFTLGTPVPAQVTMAKQLFEEFDALSNEYAGVKSLAFGFDGGTYQLLTVKKEVKSVDDMKGLVIWCEPDYNDFFKALGASPVNTPWAEVYSSLQKNMYDGLFIAAETLQSCNFAEVCKNVTMVNLNYLAAPGHLMNLDTWNSLPEEYQAAIDDPELVAWVEGELEKSSHESESEGIAWAVENMGTNVIELSAEEQQKFVDVLNESKAGMVKEWDDAGLPGTDILNRMIELSKDY